MSNLKSFVSTLDFLKSFTTGIVRPKAFLYPFTKYLIILFFTILKTHPYILSALVNFNKSAIFSRLMLQSDVLNIADKKELY